MWVILPPYDTDRQSRPDAHRQSAT